MKFHCDYMNRNVQKMRFRVFCVGIVVWGGIEVVWGVSTDRNERIPYK